MTELAASEVIQHAMIKKSIPAVGGTPEQMAAGRILEKEANKKAEWERTLEARRKPKIIEQAKIDKKANQIGTERDDTGAKKRSPGSEEEKRFNRYKDVAELYRKLTDKGFDGLNDPFVQGELVRLTEGLQKSDSDLASVLNSMSPSEQRQYFESILRDPKAMAILTENVNSKLNSPDLRDVTPQQEALAKAELDLQDAQEELKDHKDYEALNKTRREPYESRKSGATTIKGAKVQERERLESAIQSDQTSLNTKRTELNTYQSDINRLSGELTTFQRTATSGLALPTGGRTIQTVQTELNQARINEEASKKEIERLELQLNNNEQARVKIQTDHDALLAEKRTLDGERRKLERKEADAQKEFNTKQYNLEDAKNLRMSEEEDMTTGMENALAETIIQYNQTEYEVNKKMVEAGLADEKAKAANENEKAILDAIPGVLQGKERGFGKNKYRKISKAKVNGEFYQAVSGRSMEPFMRKLLKSRLDPGGNRVYSDDQINALMLDKSDGSFYTKMEPKIATELIKRKILAGGMRRDDVYALENTPWGKAAVSAAVAENKTSREQMEKLIEEKAVNNPIFMNRLWQEIKHRPWSLPLLFGFVLLPALAAINKDEPGLAA